MHELGIADAICKTVTRIAGENGVEQLHSVTVEVGDLSGVVPYFLLDCWEAVTAGSALAGVRLLLHAVPATARCEDCGSVFVVDTASLRCPDCGGDKLTPLSGQDLTIAEIEAEEA